MAVFQSISQYKEGCLIQGRDPIGVVGVPKVKARTIPHKFFLASDLCLVWISTGIAHLALMVFARDVHNPWGHELFHAAPLGPMFLFSVLVVLFADSRGLYEFPWKTSYKGDLKLLADAVTCSGIVIGVGSYLSGSRARSAGAYVLAVALAWTLMASWRKLVRSQTIPGLTEKRNVVIVGYGRFAHLLRQQLDQNPQLGYVVKGFVCRRRTPRSNPKGNGAGDPQLLGTVDELSEITRAHFIDEIFISVPSDRHLVRDIARKAKAARVLARVIPDLHDGLADDVPSRVHRAIPQLDSVSTEWAHAITDPQASYGLHPVWSRFGAFVAILRRRGVHCEAGFQGAGFLSCAASGQEGRDFCVLQIPNDGGERRRLERVSRAP